MAIDSKIARFEMLSLGDGGIMLPSPDGSLNADDRALLLGEYSFPGTAPAVDVSTLANITAKISRYDTNETVGMVKQLTIDGHRQAGIIAVGTTEQMIPIISDIVNSGLMYMHNMDSDNYVDIGWDTGDYILRIAAGEVAIIPPQPNVTTIYLKADTAEVTLHYEITERT